jgi:hypothetical protein
MAHACHTPVVYRGGLSGCPGPHGRRAVAVEAVRLGDRAIVRTAPSSLVADVLSGTIVAGARHLCEAGVVRHIPPPYSERTTSPDRFRMTEPRGYPPFFWGFVASVIQRRKSRECGRGNSGCPTLNLAEVATRP